MSAAPPAARRERILYLSHADWAWAKQRPQFLAEALAARHELLVLYTASWRRSTLAGSPSPLRRMPLPQLPLRRWSAVREASTGLQRALVRSAWRRFRPTVAWVTHPRMTALLPEDVSRVRLVYDCMDDVLAFQRAGDAGVVAQEERLLRRADLVLASSESLVAKLHARGRASVELVRNAYGGAALPAPLPPRPRAPSGPFRLGYVGTISSWMDFDALLFALGELDQLEVHLVGPREVDPPRHPRLRVHPPLAHERLVAFAREMDGMAVPFRRTPLVESVDPVKLYEYVNWGRNAVCRRWPEVERLAPFVQLYDTPAELVERLRDLAADGLLRYGAAERIAFLQDNGWPARAARVCAALERTGGSDGAGMTR